MEVFDAEPGFGHERVVLVTDRATNLQAVIAIHDTSLGPAAGGCRMWPFERAELALADAMRLSKAMTWKNALAGLPLGGGKSVIIGDARSDQTPDLLHAFGRAVQELNGKYWTAEDVGTSVEAIRTIGETCDFTFGAKRDPSPWTAYGGLKTIEAATRHATGSDDLTGLRVVVQGVGHVGAALVGLLTERGADCVVSDVNEQAVAAVVATHGVEVADVDEVYDVACDVFAPCALGGVINDATVNRIKASVIAGLANNQLADPDVHGAMLHDRGIVYAPDFVANSGGMLAIGGEIYGASDSEADIKRRVSGIGERITTILERSAATSTPPADIAGTLARETVVAARRGQAVEAG